MLENYKSSKGPDLYVYLTKNGDIKSGKKISTVDYNKSKQTFDLKKVYLEKYNEVTIYCEKAHVTFGGAKFDADVYIKRMRVLTMKKVSLFLIFIIRVISGIVIFRQG